MLLDKQINKQTKKYVATLALNEYLLSRREVSYSASIFINQSPEKIEKKNRKLNEIKQPRPPFGRLNESSLISGIKLLIHLIWLHFKNIMKE